MKQESMHNQLELLNREIITKQHSQQVEPANQPERAAAGKQAGKQDWRRSVVYQIYPKSFKNSGSGATGDLKGITMKLDYLQKLGVDYIWITPIYKSPQHDNGYDVSDYYAIDESYGTMEDFERLVMEVKARGIGIMLDIVVNHSSTEHEWFQAAITDPKSPYRGYYIWRDEPNHWESKFGGSAWEKDEASGQYYLHLFDKTQADLNWENEELRQEIYTMMRFWVEKGVSGFRLDVINLISKDQRFPDEIREDGSYGDGRKCYTDGPRIHELLQEMNREVFQGTDLLTVGEMSSTSIDHCVKYSNPDRQELSMTFSFHHLKVDYPNGEKWVKADFDFEQLKRIMSDWQVGMHAGGGWNALFWCNHDQPRIVSRFGDDGEYRERSAKMLATSLHMLQGTPYVYQGEEIGMTNPHFNEIDQYRDVETLNMYRLYREEGRTHEELMDAIKQKSRDNSRTLMQWDDSIHAGFTEGEPWIEAAPNYKHIHVKEALSREDSVFYYYQLLIQLRHELGVVTEGRYERVDQADPQIWAYARTTEQDALFVLCNYYGTEASFDMPEELKARFKGWRSRILIHNCEGASESWTSRIPLRPYESIVYYLER
ncbi:alpha,alpha-phosphotrehalase [Paenibacillus aquistagni]|uniref:alpha,alpha-phosphotrehalase n=1 Tax=Paenibacillus aquistagni TaxID=1852522 RepID=UPI001F0F056B|nr:alpha,alpha-phosphotrehalase [Paenibacillus aquistagni]